MAAKKARAGSTTKAAAPEGYAGPFPHLCSRVQAECRHVHAALVSVHGQVKRQGGPGAPEQFKAAGLPLALKTDPSPRSPGPESRGAAGTQLIKLEETTAGPSSNHAAETGVKAESDAPQGPGTTTSIKAEPGSLDPVQALGPEQALGPDQALDPDEALRPEQAAVACPPCGCDTSNWTVLDSLVRTILSQNTTDLTSQRAFASLRAAFPGGWEQVRGAPASAVADSIRVGGLADIKAGWIQAILHSLHDERGQLSLEHLRDLGDEEAKKQLCRYKGVGPKTAACVLMFAMQRDEFPVDTHVLHITGKLGWVPQGATREAAYTHLNSCLPPDIKHDLHVLMVTHGKTCCKLKTTGAKPKQGTAAAGGGRKRRKSSAATEVADEDMGGSGGPGVVVGASGEPGVAVGSGGGEEVVAVEQECGCPLLPWYRRVGGKVALASSQGEGQVTTTAPGTGPSAGADNDTDVGTATAPHTATHAATAQVTSGSASLGGTTAAQVGARGDGSGVAPEGGAAGKRARRVRPAAGAKEDLQEKPPLEVQEKPPLGVQASGEDRPAARPRKKKA